MEKNRALRQLEAVADELARDGKLMLAERTRDAVATLRRDGLGHDDADVMGPDEAATLLGIGNAGMIGRWAREGLLEGCRVGGRLRVSRRSVERLAESPVVARYRMRERQLEHVLAEFDFSDVELDPPVIPHAGRKPWDNGGPGKP